MPDNGLGYLLSLSLVCLTSINSRPSIYVFAMSVRYNMYLVVTASLDKSVLLLLSCSCTCRLAVLAHVLSLPLLFPFCTSYACAYSHLCLSIHLSSLMYLHWNMTLEVMSTIAGVLPGHLLGSSICSCCSTCGPICHLSHNHCQACHDQKQVCIAVLQAV